MNINMNKLQYVFLF